MNLNPEEIVAKFAKIASLADVQANAADIRIEELPAPHRPAGLPLGYMGVYIFSYNGKTLKVGKAGPNSDARFRSQHYNANSAPSTLAASILKDPHHIGNPDLTIQSVGGWIRENTDRINLLLDSRMGIEVLTLLEAYVQCLLKPAYEGFKSQRRPKTESFMT